MSVVKKVVKGIVCSVIILGILFFVMFQGMMKKSEEALNNQVNVAIDMNQVKDGTYKASSDGGMVKVEVEVTVKDHQITNINLLKHENGKGKTAEAMLDEMVEQNTDDVDCVTGATGSSKTIRNAVNKALQQGLER